MDSEMEIKPKALKAHALAGSLTNLPEDTLILASPIVYGFSLADKLWREFHCPPVVLH